MPANLGAIFAVNVDPTAALTENTPTGANIELTAGATTTVTVAVTAQDGATRIYTVRITRAGL